MSTPEPRGSAGDPPWMAALDEQIRLVRWWRSDLGREYVAGWSKNMVEAKLGSAIDPEQTGLRGDDLKRKVAALAEEIEKIETNDKYATEIRPESTGIDGIQLGDLREAMALSNVANHEAETLDQAATYYITTEMVELAEWAGESIPDDMQILPHHLPYAYGFALIAGEGLFIKDVRGEEFTVRAVSWGSSPGTSGVDVCWYTDPIPNSVDTDLINFMGLMKVGTPTTVLFHAGGIPFGSRMGAKHSGEMAIYETLPDQDVPSAEEIDRGAEHSERMLRFLVAFWLLSEQRIVSTEKNRPTRARQRDARRHLANLPDDDSVRTLVLRRYKDSEAHDDEPQEVMWSHRWWVRGHWRRIAWGTERAYLKWIEPYIKGPESAPLILRDTVNIWNR